MFPMACSIDRSAGRCRCRHCFNAPTRRLELLDLMFEFRRRRPEHKQATDSPALQEPVLDHQRIAHLEISLAPYRRRLVRQLQRERRALSLRSRGMAYRKLLFVDVGPQQGDVRDRLIHERQM